MTDNLQRLSAAGVAIWLDDLSRERLQKGTLAAMVRDAYVVGVTTNPSIFQNAVSSSDLYDPQVHDLNDQARTAMTGPTELRVVPTAGHLFEEPGTLEQVATMAADWFGDRLATAR